MTSSPESSRPYMPGYGVKPEGEGKGLLPWSWADERLTSAHNYWIATVRQDGRPHLMPIWCLRIDGAFYFSTGRRSRKTRNLEANSHCVISTERGDEAVIVEGIAEEISFKSLPQSFVGLYREKYGWTVEEGSDPFFVVRPKTVFGFIEAGDDFLQTATKVAVLNG